MPLTTSLIRRSSSPHSARIDPYWGYEDVGVFFILMTLTAAVFRFAVRLRLLPTLQLANPKPAIQCVIVLFLILALYLVLKLRYRQGCSWVPGLGATYSALWRCCCAAWTDFCG
jgi:hypothetical protein